MIVISLTFRIAFARASNDGPTPSAKVKYTFIIVLNNNFHFSFEQRLVGAAGVFYLPVMVVPLIWPLLPNAHSIIKI